MPPKTDGTSKIFAVVLTAFSAVVAPIIVHFVTSTPAQPVSPANTPAALEASLPSLTASPTAETLPIVLSPTQPVVLAPGGVADGGTPVVIDQLSLRVLADDLRVEGDTIRLSIRIQNLGSERRLLSFPVSSIRLTDDQGAEYLVMSDKKGCKSSAVREVKNIQIEPGAEVVLSSAGETTSWCDPKQPLVLPVFLGPVAPEARQLRVEFDGFGPFDGFSVSIDL